MQKKWLLTVPGAAIVVMVAPFVFQSGGALNSACACITVADSFAITAGVSQRVLAKTEDTDEQVSKGLATRFPKGSGMDEVRSHFRRAFESAKCQSDDPAHTWGCNIWLGRNEHHEIGYAVRFNVSQDDKVVGVSARRMLR